jgi:SAM-dependent methyltransferase
MTIAVPPLTMPDRQPKLPAPSPWVTRFIVGAPAGASLLDVACGSGRHLRLGLARGLTVTGIDRTLAGVQDLIGTRGAELIEHDLETGAAPPFAGRTFGLVVVTSYLWRPLLPSIVDAVAGHGLLLYETFAAGNERLGRPANPDFLLRPGELLEAVAGRLTPLAFEHVRIAEPPRIVQRICAVGPSHPWLRDGAPERPAP